MRDARPPYQPRPVFTVRAGPARCFLKPPTSAARMATTLVNEHCEYWPTVLERPEDRGLRILQPCSGTFSSYTSRRWNVGCVRIVLGRHSG